MMNDIGMLIEICRMYIDAIDHPADKSQFYHLLFQSAMSESAD